MQKLRRGRWATGLLLGLAIIAGSGCFRSSETRKQLAAERAEDYLKRGQPNEAIIEFRAALAIDPNYLRARVGVARAFEAKGWHRKAAGHLEKARTLDPNSMPVAVALGRNLIEIDAWSEAEEVADWIASRDPASADLLYIRAAILLGRGRLDEAKRLLGSAAGTSAEVEWVRAEVMLRSGDAEGAELVLGKALDAYPGHPKLLVGRGHVSFARGRYEKAVDFFTQAKTARPVEWEARLGLAESRARLGQRREVIEDLESIDPDARSPLVYIALGRYYLQAGRPEDAASALATVAHQVPKLVWVRLLLGQAYLDSGKPDVAAAQFEEAIQRSSNEARAYLGLAVSAIRLGQPRDALAHLDKVSARLGGDPVYHFARGNALLLLGRLDDALKEGEVARRLAPEAPQPSLLLGQVRARQGRDKDAVEQFRRATELDAAFTPARVALGELYRPRDPAAALAQIDAALRVEPTSLAVVRAKTGMLVGQDRMKEAFDFVQSTIRQDPNQAELYGLLGTLYLAAREPDRAQAAFRKGAELDEKALEPQRGLARLALQRGRSPEAMRYLQTAVRDHPGDTVAVMLLVSLYDETAQYDLAISVLEAADKANPSQPIFDVALGRMYMKKGRYEEAVTLLSDLIAKTPDLMVARLVRGQAYLAKGDGLPAVRDLSEVARAYPASATTRQLLSRALASVGRTQEAQAVLGEALKLDPDPGSIARREAAARSLLARGQVAAAQKEVEQILDRAAGHPEGNVLMAQILERQDRSDEAAGYLRAALRANPSHSEANIRLARYLLRVGQRDEALGLVRTALRTNAAITGLFGILGRVSNALTFAQKLEETEPRSAAAAALTGWVLFSQSNPKAAISAFQRAIAYRPEHQEAHRGLGEAQQALGDIDRAAESYRRALAIDGSDVHSLNNLAWILADVRNRPDEALPLASKAASLAPDWGDVMDTLGWVQFRRGAYSEAAKALGRAVELSPKNATVHYHLGLTHSRMGRKTDAEASLRRASELGRGLKENEKVIELLKELGR